MTKPTYTCSGCGKPKLRSDFHEAHYDDRKREVTSRCRECRSEDYFSKRYDTICIQCMKHRPLDENETCKKCNAENGIRQCNGCSELLALYVEFRGERKTCEKCRATRRASAVAASAAAQLA